MAHEVDVVGQVIEGAGHSPAVDDPAATAAALLSFWARTEDAAVSPRR